MSGEFWEVTYDKFIFRVRKGYLYHAGECWAKAEGGIVTVGLTDFLQKTAGDVAFLEAPEMGAEVPRGGDAGVIETIKSTIILISPVTGVIREINAALEERPELINEDPYGEGWIFKLAPTDWERDKKELMNDEAYLPVMEEKIKKEMEKRSS
jgi:glycine cleavage system H protein